MLFSEVIGQREAKQLARQMVEGDRLPHAVLLYGSPGGGSLALALAFAQYVLCTDRRPDDACGECANCRRSSRMIHPDLHFSFPVTGANVTSDDHLVQWRAALAQNPYLEVNDWLQLIGAENKQGNINKEECNRIIHKLSLKSFEDNYKILLMWLPEYLGKEGNRLLKLVEEPPENTLFLMVSENTELILPTILSRCQLIKVPPLSDEAVAGGLQDRGLAAGTEAQAIARLANGNFNEAIQMAARQEGDNAKLFIEWLRKCFRGHGVEMVNWSEKLAALGRENQKNFLLYGLHFLREYLALKFTGESEVRLRGEELSTAGKMIPIIGLEQLEKLTHLFSECVYHIERNAHPKILFLDASIQVNQILKQKTPIAALAK
ncbi:MAG: hypothetical protein H6562_01465 [Lewinellaceae bacterium]|nr:hypothetical protein [Lewinella sp.]MCB9277557.1 hypothetical protein [Lewinellaceae bacterium]